MRERAARKSASKFAIILLLIFYVLLSFAYYKKPERFFFFLFKDLQNIKEKSFIGGAGLIEMFPSVEKAIAKYKRLKLVKLSTDESVFKKIKTYEKKGVGYFTYMFPTILWERLLYFAVFSIPVLFLSFFYFARLWQLKTREIFITDPIKQKAFAFLQNSAFLLLLIMVGLPTVPLHYGVMILYTLPFWIFGKSYYSGAWLWRKRGGS